MNKNDLINLKFFSSIYLKLKERKVTSLEMKVNALMKEIENEKNSLDQNNQYFDLLRRENISIQNEYLNLQKLFENENKSIAVKNNNYHVSMWENVFIQKKSPNYVIQAKKSGEDIYIFDKSMNDFIAYFLTLNYSIIVLSISRKSITLQFSVRKSD